MGYRQITPSKVGRWDGVTKPGDRFTIFQHGHANKYGINLDQLEVITVRRPGTSREFWWGRGDSPPMVEHECPILERRPGGRVMILTPGGQRLVVNEDGSLLSQSTPGGYR